MQESSVFQENTGPPLLTEFPRRIRYSATAVPVGGVEKTTVAPHVESTLFVREKTVSRKADKSTVEFSAAGVATKRQ